MGKDRDPGINLQHPSWKYDNLSRPSNHRPPDIGPQNTNSMVFPIYSNPYGCAFIGNGSLPFPGYPGRKLYPMSPATIPNLDPINARLGLAATQKGFLVFDQSGDQTNLIFSSVSPPFPNLNHGNLGMDLLGSNKTDVPHGHENTEMHEDTEEIDALLYSDSYDAQDEEEASTGHSPLEATGSTEEVASSFVPAKRRRLNKELDASFADTASSELVHCSESHQHQSLDKGDESSFVQGGEQSVAPEEHDSPATAALSWSMQAKRERIRETVSVLRRIIPGGKGKDAAAVIDEAIRYLRSLKLKAKAMGAPYL